MRWDDGQRHALAALRRFEDRSDDDKPVMRMLLEGDSRFEWPDGETHYTVPLNGLPEHLAFNRFLKQPPERPLDRSKKSKRANIQQYRLNSETFRTAAPHRVPFKHAFAVKTIRDEDVLVSRSNALAEVRNMNRLYHPHVAALLGTFTIGERLHILIYPAACCDLEHFMQSVSHDIETAGQSGSGVEYQMERLDISDGPPSYSCQIPPHNATLSSQVGRNNIDYDWPLKAILPDRLRAIHGFYYCILSALAYLSKQAVRHKDIKPANILIDLSGSIVLTDFGISKRFEPGQSQETDSGDSPRTAVYAAPECHDKTAKRNERSDIFSVGCVFLEMVSLELGYTLEKTKHFREGSCYANKFILKKVHKFIDKLAAEPKTKPSDQVFGEIKSMLPALKTMLHIQASARLSAQDYLPTFSFASNERCRDCHQDYEQRWEPTELQKSQELEERKTRKEHAARADVTENISEVQEMMARSYLRLPSPPLSAAVGGNMRLNVQPSPREPEAKILRRRSLPLSSQAIPEDLEGETRFFSGGLSSESAHEPRLSSSTMREPPPQRSLTFTPDRMHHNSHHGLATGWVPRRPSSSTSTPSTGSSTPVLPNESDSWERVDLILPFNDPPLPPAKTPDDKEKVILLDLQEREIEKVTYRFVKKQYPDRRIDVWNLDSRLVTFVIPAEGETGGVFRLDLSQCFGFKFNYFVRRFQGRYSKLCVVGRADVGSRRPS